MSNRNRQPAGTPIGGEFAKNTHDEAGGSLVTDEVNIEDIVDRIRERRGDYFVDLDHLEELATANGNGEEASDLADQVRDQKGDYLAALDDLGDLAGAEDDTEHNAVVAEMTALVRERHPFAKGIAFAPHTDEIDYDYDDSDGDDFEAAWVDAGAVERTPIAHFGDDPEDQVEFDETEDAELVAKLQTLSKNLSRKRCGFTAIGEYEIEVHFD